MRIDKLKVFDLPDCSYIAISADNSGDVPYLSVDISRVSPNGIEEPICSVDYDLLSEEVKALVYSSLSEEPVFSKVIENFKEE